MPVVTSPAVCFGSGPTRDRLVRWDVSQPGLVFEVTLIADCRAALELLQQLLNSVYHSVFNGDEELHRVHLIIDYVEADCSVLSSLV